MTLWKVTAGGVRLTDELFTVRTPCGVRPRDRDTGGGADGANGSIPAFTPGPDNGALSGYGLMNQPCQRFTDGLALDRSHPLGTTVVSAERSRTDCSSAGYGRTSS
jgi:hypothetical protein